MLKKPLMSRAIKISLYFFFYFEDRQNKEDWPNTVMKGKQILWLTVSTPTIVTMMSTFKQINMEKKHKKKFWKISNQVSHFSAGKLRNSSHSHQFF